MKKYCLVLIIAIGFLPFAAQAAFITDLRYGNRGQSVYELQNFLITQGLLKVNANGIFGPATRNAVIAYQASVGLPATGFVGPMTREKINTNGHTNANTSNVIIMPQPTLTPSVIPQPNQITVITNDR